MYLESDPAIYMPIKVSLWDDRGGDKVLLAQANFEVTEVFQNPGHAQEQVVGKSM